MKSLFLIIDNLKKNLIQVHYANYSHKKHSLKYKHFILIKQKSPNLFTKNHEIVFFNYVVFF